jgi:hypothetical protein
MGKWCQLVKAISALLYSHEGLNMFCWNQITLVLIYIHIYYILVYFGKTSVHLVPSVVTTTVSRRVDGRLVYVSYRRVQSCQTTRFIDLFM